MVLPNEEWVIKNRDALLVGLIVGLMLLLIPWVCAPLRRAFISLCRMVINRLRWRQHIVQEALKVFEGHVEVIDDRPLSKHASPQRVEKFHGGGPVYWDVIAANADIRRDKERELLDVLLLPKGGLRIICVVGEPGAGKSTLAWRAAAKLYQEQRAVVIRAVRGNDPELWHRMAQFWKSIQRPFYILADDLFREDEVVDVLGTLDPSMPVTILGTSQVGECRCHGLPCEPVAVHLEGPSKDEKDRMLHKLNIRKEDLTSDQLKRLENATSFRVMMMEVTTGEDHAKAIERSVKHLKDKDPLGYRAYMYVCFCYQYDVCIPSAVLSRLDSEGFHRLADRPAVQDLIFEDDRLAGSFKAGHSRTAAIAFRSYFRLPHLVLLEIANAVDPAHETSRKFLTSLILRIARTDRPSISSGLDGLIDVMKRVRLQATGFSEIRFWFACFSELQVRDEAALCEEALLSTAPVNSCDCVYLAGRLCRHHRERDALPILSNYIGHHPDEGHPRPTFLRIVEQYGTPDEKSVALRETHEWLRTHQEESFVRTTFLGFVERNEGSTELIEGVLAETREWLAKHPEDNSVRTAFLGFVERYKGPKELIEGIWAETHEWLAKHPEDSFVRTAFLGFVERNKGSRRLMEGVLVETREWLATHPEDSDVRGALLGFVERKGPNELGVVMLKDTREWLAKHPADANVRTVFLRFIKNKAPEMAPELMNEMKTWLVDHTMDTSVRVAIMGLIRRHGSGEQLHELVETIQEAVTAQSQSEDGVRTLFDCVIGDRDLEGVFETELRDGIAKNGANRIAEQWQTDPNKQVLFARYLCDAGYLEDAERIYKAILTMPPNQTSGVTRMRTRYNYGVLLLQSERFLEAVDQFQSVLGGRKSHVAARLQLAHAIRELGARAIQRGDGAEAAKCFRRARGELHGALRWAESQKEKADKGPIYAEIGWLHIDCREFEQSIVAFEKANKETAGGHWANYWGAAKAHIALGRFNEALSAIQTIRTIGPESLQPPASDEVAELVRRCQEALDADNSHRDSAPQ